MRTTERADVARLSPDHQMQNPLNIVGSSLQVSLLLFLNLKRTLAPSVHIRTFINIHATLVEFRNRFVRTHSIYSVATSPWHNNKMHCIFRHRSVTFQIIRGPTQCDIVRAVPSHLQYPTIVTDRGTISTAKGASNSRYFPSSNKSSLFSSLFRTGSQQKT